MMNQDEIKKLIDSCIEEKLESWTNFTVPQHKHNGVDSPTIPVTNILIDPNFGVPFFNGTTVGYNMYIIDKLNGSGLVIEPNTGVFGGSAGIFYIGGGYRYNENFGAIRLQAGNSLNTLSYSIEPTVARYSTTGDFALQLPDTTRTSSPLPGMIAFEAGQFYYCVTAGIWTPF